MDPIISLLGGAAAGLICLGFAGVAVVVGAALFFLKGWMDQDNGRF